MTDEPPQRAQPQASSASQVRRGSMSRGSKTWLVLTAALIAIGVAGQILPQGESPRPEGGFPAFDLQGHRGARGLEPENSLPAIAAALALGVDTLELDLGMTRDGVLVAHHDPRLDPDRTRGPDGAWLAAPTPLLSELTQAELGRYDIGRARPGSRIARRFPDQLGRDGVPIPTLEQAFELAEARSAGAVRYNLEIKTSPLAPEDTATPETFARALTDAIAEAGVGARVLVQSFDWRALAAMQRLAPEIPTVYLSAEAPWLDNLERGQPGASPWTAGLDIDAVNGSVPRAVQSAGGAVWSPYYRNLRVSDLRDAHNLGLRVVVWTVNDPDDMASLIDLGVDGIITDYPQRLRRVMAEKALMLPTPAPGK